MTELFHITERALWLEAVRAGDYRMSARSAAWTNRRAEGRPSGTAPR
jgi:hypothetical protein